MIELLSAAKPVDAAGQPSAARPGRTSNSTEGEAASAEAAMGFDAVMSDARSEASPETAVTPDPDAESIPTSVDAVLPDAAELILADPQLAAAPAAEAPVDASAPSAPPPSDAVDVVADPAKGIAVEAALKATSEGVAAAAPIQTQAAAVAAGPERRFAEASVPADAKLRSAPAPIDLRARSAAAAAVPGAPVAGQAAEPSLQPVPMVQGAGIAASDDVPPPTSALPPSASATPASADLPATAPLAAAAAAEPPKTPLASPLAGRPADLADAAASLARADGASPDGLVTTAALTDGRAEATATRLDRAFAPPPEAPPAVVRLEAALRKMDGGEIEIRLDPPELGRVRVSLAPTETGLVATVMAERPEAAELLRRHGEALLRGLAEAGHEDVSLQFGSDDRRGAARDEEAPSSEFAAVDAPGFRPSTEPGRSAPISAGLDLRV